MTKLIKNLAVKLREYTDNQGRQKAQWQKIGSVMQTDQGGQFILLDRHINLAGLPFKEGSTSVMVSLFDVEDKDNVSNAQTEIGAPVKFKDNFIPF